MDINKSYQTVYSGTLLEIPFENHVQIINKPDFMHFEQGTLKGIPWSNLDSFVIDFESQGIKYQKLFLVQHIDHFQNFYESYMKYGYGDQLHEYAPKDIFTYDINVVQPTKNYQDACKEAAHIAKYQAEKSNLELTLLMSGGVDSEAMAHVFLNAGVKFTPVIIEMNNGLNDYDIKYALDFCRNTNLTPKIYHFNVYQFLDNKEHFTYGLKYRARYVELQMIFRMLDNHPEIFPVLPANIPFVVSSNNVTGFNLLIDQFHSLYRYLYLNSRPGIENFFYYTAEQYSAAISSPVYASFLSGKSMDYYDKVSVYNYFGMPVLPKPRKYAGWEKVKYMFTKKKHEETNIWDEDCFFKKTNLQYLDKFLLMEYKWPSSIVWQ